MLTKEFLVHIILAIRNIRNDSLSGNIGSIGRSHLSLCYFGLWSGSEFALQFNLFQCCWSVWRCYLLAFVGRVLGQLGCIGRFLYEAIRKFLR